MVAVIISTYAIIFVAELPDKTGLASLVLATRYRTREVIAGAWLAFLVQTAIAVAAGSLLQVLPSRPIHIAAGLGFLIFALLALRRDEDEELLEEACELETVRRRRASPWLTSFLVIFAAEWGDLTQLATAALVARTRQPLPVAAGAVAALWSVTVLAALTGSQVGRLLTPKLLQRASAAILALVGLIIIGAALC